MRIPRRHRFRVRASAAALFHALPPGDRFRFASSVDSKTTFGHGARATIASRVQDLAEGDDPLLRPKLRALLPRVPVDRDSSTFRGGAVGFVTYERGFPGELLGRRPLPRPGPDVYFAVYDTLAIADPAQDDVEVVSWGLTEEGSFDESLALRRAEELESLLGDARGGSFDHDSERGALFDAGTPRVSLSREEHARACETILEAIARGDLYQANLTARFDVPFRGDPAALFERVLASSPAPHAAYLEAQGLAIVSASPEQLLRADERDIEARPIKGTAPRHEDPEQDRTSAEALLHSTKDAAELLMITDLLRNDFGKVCEPGSVRVPVLRTLESFAHVHHLVSTIRGRLRPGLDALDALHAVFPCGSIAGAPKRRAMELLATLEPAPRDVYTGSVGWMGFDRNALWSVAIRTGILFDETFSFGAGGGIVAESKPESEWEELLVKAKGMAQALGVAVGHETIGGPR